MLCIASAALVVGGSVALLADRREKHLRFYPIHHNIQASMFYVGEAASADNGYIANNDSAWDGTWVEGYGGIDDPHRRDGWLPAAFTPRENPFYVALPYNDFSDAGERKPSAKYIYWADVAASGHSLVKNRWVEVCSQGTCAYGQWEDAGPFGEDDVAYVFGTARPANTRGLRAGIDVSPAIDHYLQLQGAGIVSWRFIEEPPSGPWRAIITK